MEVRDDEKGVDGWPMPGKNMRILQVTGEELITRLEIEKSHDEDCEVINEIRGEYLYKILEEYENRNATNRRTRKSRKRSGGSRP